MQNNTITVFSKYLKHINEQLITLNIDTKHLMMALQAVQVDCEVSKGVIHTVNTALSGNAALSEKLSDQLDDMLSAPQGVISND